MAGAYAGFVRSIGRAIAVLLIVLGVFWAGRESTHGLNAFWDHWWCPMPLVAVVLGVAGILAAQHLRRPQKVASE